MDEPLAVDFDGAGFRFSAYDDVIARRHVEIGLFKDRLEDYAAAQFAWKLRVS